MCVCVCVCGVCWSRRHRVGPIVTIRWRACPARLCAPSESERTPLLGPEARPQRLVPSFRAASWRRAHFRPRAKGAAVCGWWGRSHVAKTTETLPRAFFLLQGASCFHQEVSVRFPVETKSRDLAALTLKGDLDGREGGCWRWREAGRGRASGWPAGQAGPPSRPHTPLPHALREGPGRMDLGLKAGQGGEGSRMCSPVPAGGGTAPWPAAPTARTEALDPSAHVWLGRGWYEAGATSVCLCPGLQSRRKQRSPCNQTGVASPWAVLLAWLRGPSHPHCAEGGSEAPGQSPASR